MAKLIPEIKKQVTMSVPISDWKLIRMESAKQNTSINRLFRIWIAPHIKKLREEAEK